MRAVRPARATSAAPRRSPARPAPPVDPASARSFALQGLVLQVLVMKLVAELVTFRGEILRVLCGRSGLDRHLLDHFEPEALDAGDLLRVVREDADRAQAELGEDLVADSVVA